MSATCFTGNDEDILESKFYNSLVKKYENKNQNEIKRLTTNDEWMYSWLCIDLHEWEVTEMLKFGLESRELQNRVQLLQDRVLKIREQLAYLQTQTPVWRLLEYIAASARDMSSEYSEWLSHIEMKIAQKYNPSYILDQEMSEKSKDMYSHLLAESRQNSSETLSYVRKQIDHDITQAVAKFVFQVLQHLYKQLSKESETLRRIRKEKEKGGDRSGIDDRGGDDGACGVSKVKIWMSEIYPDLLLVGPLGERPIHVCALMAARFRGEANGIRIADGIVEGMKQFLEVGNGRWKSEARAKYGKDYLAAVGSLIEIKNYTEKSDSLWRDNIIKRLPKLPLLNVFVDWYEQRLLNVGKRLESDKYSEHMRAMVLVGLYEGETILFPLIASGDEHAVRWLLCFEERMFQKPGEGSMPKERDDDGLWLIRSRAHGAFFRPVFQEWLTSFYVCEGWAWYSHCRGRGNNQFASSLKTYFGFDVLSFAVSQGNIEIFKQLLKEMVKIWIRFVRKDSIIHELQTFLSGDTANCDRKVEVIKLLLLEGFKDDEAALEQFVKTAILQRKDEFGNTVLHLAAWNGQADMYDLLIDLGANPHALNKDGLTAFTLSARFGLWDMFHHIWKRHFSRMLWSFGNVIANEVDYMQFEAINNGLTSFVSVREIELCVDALAEHLIEERLKIAPYPLQSKEGIFGIYQTKAIRAMLENKLKAWCEETMTHFLLCQYDSTALIPEKENKKNQDGKKRVSLLKYQSEKHEKSRDPLKNALRLITLFRPHDWYNQTKDKLEEVVMSKWSQGYYLVHIGDSLLPYCVLILIFGLMWQQRRIHVLSHHFWWAPGLVHAPNPKDGVESTCGWASIRDSFSGRIQATLIVYGVPSLLRLSLVQCRLRPSDLDENVDWKVSSEEVVNFLYLNLESLLHIVIAGLFITIGAARVLAGDECDVWYIRMEKNATAIAALALFFNLFILCKPYKGFGLLVLTWYRFLLADVFNFLVMYGMIFSAFLIALQTLHNANYSYLMWMDQTDTILPQVQAAIGLMYPDAQASIGMTYLMNDNAPTSKQLLTTETALDGCALKRRTTDDTAFALLEISFGDGLSDALEQARSKPYECAGFSPDLLTGYLLVLWVFLTNTLIINMLIAMMNHTFNQQIGNINAVWLLDVSKRIIRYDNSFPELAPWMARPVHLHPMYSRKYWLARLDDLKIIMQCYPEVHFLLLIIQLLKIYVSRYRYPAKLDAEAENSVHKPDVSWVDVKGIIDKYKKEGKDYIKDSTDKDTEGCCTGHRLFWSFMWHPHATLIHQIYRTSLKAVSFGYRAEKQSKGENSEKEVVQSRLEMLILRLDLLKNTLKNHKLKLQPRGSGGVGGGKEGCGDKTIRGDGSHSPGDYIGTGAGGGAAAGAACEPRQPGAQFDGRPQLSVRLVYPVAKEAVMCGRA